MREAVIHQNHKNLPNTRNPQRIFALGRVMWHQLFITFSACLSRDFTVFYSKFKSSLPLLMSDTSLSGLVPLSDVSLILLPPLMNVSDSNCLSNCLVGFLSTTSRNQLHILKLLFYWRPIHLLSYFLRHVFQPSQLRSFPTLPTGRYGPWLAGLHYRHWGFGIYFRVALWSNLGPPIMGHRKKKNPDVSNGGTYGKHRR